jgi:pimeloyl-ACP methyl ester carboxylesterase
MSDSVAIERFSIAVDEAVLDDLRLRLARTRWPDHVGDASWAYGADPAYLRDLVSYWRHAFDWRGQERALNRLGQFRARIGDLSIHFMHERGRGPHPLPLILTNGWPSSFLEYVDVLPLLTDPGAHGGDPADAFDVVVPSLPGYGFSEAPRRPGVVNADIADAWSRLMVEGLGYKRFGAQGTDIGAGVTSRLALRHAPSVIGIHLSAVGFAKPPRPWSPAEAAYWDEVAAWEAAEGAYEHLQATKPQTLGYALNDSPAGLAAWIVEKFRAWSDSGGDVESRFRRDWLLANLTVYWATATIASSMRLYLEHSRHAAPLVAGQPIAVPAGFAIFANELVPAGRPPRELAERYFAVKRWSELARGGHFPAIEEPAAFAAELRSFFRPLRASERS